MPSRNPKKPLRHSLKALLRDTLEWIESEQTELLKDSPYASASNAEVKLFAALRGESRSISELSRYLGVTRQAVHTTVHKLIDKGVVCLEYPEGNKRDKLVMITERGREVQKLTAEHFEIIEEKVAKSIGRKNLELIRELLQEHQSKTSPHD